MEKQRSWVSKHPILTGIIFLVIIGIGWSAIMGPNDKTVYSIQTESSSGNNQNTVISSATWHEVTTFSGTQNKNTDTFETRGSKFRLTYTVRPDNEYSLFSFYVYPDGEDKVYKDTASLNSGTDTTTIYSGSGKYYLKIIAANLEGWNIKVEDYY